MERGLSRSARGRNSARRPSRHSALTPSASTSTGGGPRATEPPRQSFAAMQAGIFAILDSLGAGQTNGASLRLHVEVRLADAGHLGDQHEVVAFAKYIQWRVAAGAARA